MNIQGSWKEIVHRWNKQKYLVNAYSIPVDTRKPITWRVVIFVFKPSCWVVICNSDFVSAILVDVLFSFENIPKPESMF